MKNYPACKELVISNWKHSWSCRPRLHVPFKIMIFFRSTWLCTQSFVSNYKLSWLPVLYVSHYWVDSFKYGPTNKKNVPSLTLCMLGNFARLFYSADFCFKLTFWKNKSFRNNQGVKQFGSRSGLGPGCLQRQMTKNYPLLGKRVAAMLTLAKSLDPRSGSYDWTLKSFLKKISLKESASYKKSMKNYTTCMAEPSLVSIHCICKQGRLLNEYAGLSVI